MWPNASTGFGCFSTFWMHPIGCQYNKHHIKSIHSTHHTQHILLWCLLFLCQPFPMLTKFIWSPIYAAHILISTDVIASDIASHQRCRRVFVCLLFYSKPVDRRHNEPVHLPPSHIVCVNLLQHIIYIRRAVFFSHSERIHYTLFV